MAKRVVSFIETMRLRRAYKCYQDQEVCRIIRVIGVIARYAQGQQVCRLNRVIRNSKVLLNVVVGEHA